MAKHACAVYFDKTGKRHLIRADELSFPLKLEEARSHQLLDLQEEFRMSVRGGKTPHFFALAVSARKLSDERNESDPAHNHRVDKLLHILSQLPPDATIELGTTDWNQPEDEQWSPFADIKNYVWGKEVTRAFGEDGKCRHDLFGMPPGLNLTGRFPWVAIEVIHHHYPNAKTLTGLIEMTRLLPLVVLFDLVEAPDYFMKVEPQARRIRTIFYLYRGRAWRNVGDLGSEITAVQLRATMKTMLERRTRAKRSGDT